MPGIKTQGSSGARPGADFGSGALLVEGDAPDPEPVKVFVNWHDHHAIGSLLERSLFWSRGYRRDRCHTDAPAVRAGAR